MPPHSFLSMEEAVFALLFLSYHLDVRMVWLITWSTIHEHMCASPDTLQPFVSRVIIVLKLVLQSLKSTGARDARRSVARLVLG